MKSWAETEFGCAREQFREEFASWYAAYPTDTGEIEKGLDVLLREHPRATAFEKKRWVYRAIRDNCRVRIFRYCPFYFEVDTGADRNMVGAAFPPTPGLGSWVMRSDPSHLEQDFDEWRLPYMKEDIIYTTMFADLAHNAMPIGSILRLGFDEIRRRAEEGLQKQTGDPDYLKSVIEAADLIAGLGQRFSKQAAQMMREEQDPAVYKRLKRIRDAAVRCPMKPAETFYEAINTIWYMKELSNAADAAGTAILGRVDLLLQPYYERDIARSEISQEEARDLVYWFCSMVDAKWDLTRAIYGTNTSINIGGCDRNGQPVYNDVTKMILDAYRDLKLINPKLQARIPENPDEEYLQALGALAAGGTNVLSIYNDKTIIGAQTRAGKNAEDARDYVNGGCQEVLLAETEFNSRAFCYLSPCKFLEMMMSPKKYVFFDRERILPKDLETADDFEEFLDRVFINISMMINAIAWRFNEFEKRWSGYNPIPLVSAGFPGCRERGLDLTQGGADYNDSAFALVGAATFIDSLWAVKQAVFAQKRFTFRQLKDMLVCNFAGYEKERLYLLNKIGKYGDDTEEINAFACTVFDRLAAAMANMENTRGGSYEASVWSFYGYEWMKAGCGAMPDGRKAGERLSRGVNPCETTKAGIAAVLHSLSALHTRRYPQPMLTYLTLPLVLQGSNEKMCRDLIMYFCECGGSSADFDVLDSSAIEDALLHPQQHQDLVVRVCGYSARFVDLEPQMQVEIAQRYQRT